MSLINHRVSSLLAIRLHGMNSIGLLQSMQKLATGQRINRGADDPAGLIISEQLRSMLSAIDAESQMLQRTDHVARSAEGALQEVSSLINEAKALVVANANSAGMSDEEKQANQMQLDSILDSIDRIAGSTMFNGKHLLDGSLTLTANGQSITIGSVATHDLGVTDFEGETYTLADLRAGNALNAVGGNLEAAQKVLDAARENVASMRGSIGAFQKHAIGSRLSSLDTSSQYIALANSMIRDTDYAQESSNLLRMLILQRSSVGVIGLVNTNAANVLALLA